ncbi:MULTISPECIES: hypothetical protein [Shouchella]|uniref:Lipoprotein n=3 Tax=Bacillaceae TaxID=186817 RepID=A0A060M268_9BACI|nr:MULTISPECIES: hypothetical protein [Bacillaceae]RQW20502.1 hypothetical protein EH196_10340 [Bacillus sp. C1-1]AIC94638.1 hypothetical protein BleG1_2060 [Shouchella lehensis G1]KQL51808.1 hypothetical protein AN965_18785 [Alkalicoccobacillus plakortidis]MBG9784477.1 hypothetical protein [Shouchella lehensis]TES50518.1 hypothetical protein E2L03_00880 [Shouchella lehensis]
MKGRSIAGAVMLLFMGGCFYSSMDANALLEEAFNQESEFLPFELVLEDEEGWKMHVFAESEGRQRVDSYIDDSLLYSELYDGQKLFEVDHQTKEVYEYEREGLISTGRNYLVNEIDYLSSTHDIRFSESKNNKLLKRNVFHVEFYQDDVLEYELWVDKQSLVVLKQTEHVNGEQIGLEASYFKIHPVIPEEVFILDEQTYHFVNEAE